jgi:hypothetical protein
MFHLLELSNINKLFIDYRQVGYWQSINGELQEVTTRESGAGLNHLRSGRRMTKSQIHRMLRNPIDYGDFVWKGTLYRGSDEPLISKKLFDSVQAVFDQANRPRYGKHRQAFVGLLTWTVWMCHHGRGADPSGELGGRDAFRTWFVESAA